MKRVLIVVGTHLVNAGVPNVVMNIVRSLKDKCSFDVVVGGSKEGYYDQEFLSYGGEIFRYDKYEYNDGLVKYIKSGKQLYNVVMRVLEKKQYDVIHCHNGYLAGWALKAGKDKNVPVRINHSHGTYYANGKNFIAKSFKKGCMKKGVKYATDRLACSSLAGDTLFLGASYENVLNPIDVNAMTFEKQSHEGINLLQIGYYCPLKNQKFSLQIVKKLKDMGEQVKIRFIGFEYTEGYLDGMKEYVAQNGLEDNVEFLPSNCAKGDVFPTNDFLLLPSTSEGLPLVTLESQSSDIYTIVSNAVSKDIDMGICSFLPNNHLDAWVNEILDKKGKNLVADRQKLLRTDVSSYMANLSKIMGC